MRKIRKLIWPIESKLFLKLHTIETRVNAVSRVMRKRLLLRIRMAISTNRITKVADKMSKEISFTCPMSAWFSLTI